MSTTTLDAKPTRTRTAKRPPKPEATALGQPLADGIGPAFALLPIPLKHLIPSTLNVRKTHGNAVAELAASIRAHGLLHNLTVTAQADPQGNPTGTYEVVAGGRRLAALLHLAKEGALDAETYPVPCRVVEAAGAAERSLAENVAREAMHPADEFLALRDLTEQGTGVEAIAAPEWQRHPNHLRAALREGKIDAAHDSRARFVGVEAYTAAGGAIERDLFQPEHAGYLLDGALLDRLAMAKLESLAATVRAEGWTWVEIALSYPALHEFARLYPIALPLTPEQAAEREALEREREDLVAEHGEEDEYPEAVAQRLDDLERRIDEIDAAARNYREEERAVAGAIVSLSGDEPTVYRGLLRKGDKAKLKQGQAVPETGQATLPTTEEPTAESYSGALVEDLTAQRTAALRAVLLDRPDVALVAVTHNLAVQTFYAGYHVPSALEIDVKQDARLLDRHAQAVEPSRAGKALKAKRLAWAARLPKTAADLWAWLTTQEQPVILDLLAYCAAQTVNAVQLPHQQPTDPRLEAANRLAQALQLDMAEWWQPTADHFFMRVKREQTLEAVATATGAKDVVALSKMKKNELAAEAEKRLAGTRWLLSVLKT